MSASAWRSPSTARLNRRRNIAAPGFGRLDRVFCPDRAGKFHAACARPRRDGDDYVINVTKRSHHQCAHAGLFTVMARTDPAQKGEGVSFAVERHAGGCRKRRRWGNRAPTLRRHFRGLPRARYRAHRRGRGAGFKTAMKVLDKGRLHIAAACVGLSDRDHRRHDRLCRASPVRAAASRLSVAPGLFADLKAEAARALHGDRCGAQA
jgi:acyl-CoA dehydrogenase